MEARGRSRDRSVRFCENGLIARPIGRLGRSLQIGRNRWLANGSKPSKEITTDRWRKEHTKAFGLSNDRNLGIILKNEPLRAPNLFPGPNQTAPPILSGQRL